MLCGGGCCCVFGGSGGVAELEAVPGLRDMLFICWVKPAVALFCGVGNPLAGLFPEAGGGVGYPLGAGEGAPLGTAPLALGEG